jgi:hypothetical protein
VDDSTWRKSSYSSRNGSCVEAWIKSSHSMASGDCVEWARSSHSESGNCVETAERPGVVLLRDSKDPRHAPPGCLGPGGPELEFTEAEWTAFLRRVRAGS